MERIPSGRWDKPEDMKESVVFLASRASNYINGQWGFVFYECAIM
jgi:2-dehydro-3-deoxy-D-gluconate 5-dehydrogenase